MTKRETVSILSHLVDMSADGEKGFAEVAGEATNADLKGFFKRRSADCGAAVTELQALVQSLGGPPQDSPPARGGPRPCWDMRASLIEDANLTALKLVEVAEDKAEAAYLQALAAELPYQIRSVLQRQHNGAMRNHLHIHELRLSYSTPQPA